MGDSRWQRVEEIFHQAAELAPEARSAFLDQVCAGDEPLRKEVESLLAHDAENGSTLAKAVADAAGSTVTMIEDLTGRTIGPYQVLGRIGAGGMGVVYKARDTELGRTVAIKALPADRLSDPDRKQRFIREAKAASALNHPNIVTIHTITHEGGAECIVMEYVEGRTLAETIPKGGLPLEEALPIAIEIADAMAAAHGAGIVHRDLKPSNIMRTESGRVKVLDFGLAKLAGNGESPQQSESTETGRVMGTAAYMSPEQAQGRKVDRRTDIFSFGCVLYEMLAGRRAFQAESTLSTLAAILHQEPAPLGGDTPHELAMVVVRCLRKDPARRFQDMGDVKIELEELKAESQTDQLPGAATSGPERRRRWIRAARIPPRPAPRRRVALAALAAVVLAAALFGLGQRWERGRSSPPVFRQLTFRRGIIQSARFAPDGHTIVYGAYWDGRPVQLFSERPESPESSPLPLPGADILSISSTGEMALSLGRRKEGWNLYGTLARAPLAGGAPRELLEMVQEAVWNPDGSALAVVRAELPGGGTRLEYPAGKVLYQAEGWLSHPRFSPEGDAIAFAEHPAKADDAGHVSLVDLRGRKRDLTGHYPGGVQGIAWTPAGDEIWYTAVESGTNFELRAVSRRGGPSRVVLRVPGRLTLQDISRDGRVLVTRDTMRPSLMVWTADSGRERDLAWLDLSDVRDLSPDGTRVLFTEGGEGARTEGAYLRKTDGSPAVRIGNGYAFGLSPDGRWALSVVSKPPAQLFLLPTGAGEPRVLPRGKIFVYAGFQATWFADSRRFVLTGREQGRQQQLYIQDIQGGEPRAISGEALVLGSSRGLSPDQQYVAAIDNDRKTRIVPVEGGSSRPAPGTEPDEMPAGWSADGRSLYIYSPVTGAPTRVYLVDVASGQRRLWKEITPADPAGTYGIVGLAVNPDGRSYVYNQSRTLSDLYLVEGLK
jgi:Tol biopolymer transport system component/predicted Ser/Thr protein kinase